MSKKAIINRVQWYLNFANAELEKLQIGDKVKLWLEIMAQLSRSGIHEFAAPGSIGDQIIKEMINQKGAGENVFDWQRLTSYQDKLCNFLEFMQTRINNAFAIQGKDWTLSDNTDFYPELGSMKTNIAVFLASDGIAYERKEKKDRTGKPIYYFKAKPDSVKNSKIRLSFKADKDEDTFLFNFIKSLDGLPISSFNRCRECNKWYFHLSIREREFCSNKCAARFGIREKRKLMKEKQPEKYKEELKKSSERAHRAYAKKITHGKVIRPYKHK
jgi:hypothetical protein